MKEFSMENIVLVRIDQRLIHGQVALQWCGALDVHCIIVANDEVSQDSLRQGLMKKAVPSQCETYFMSIDETIEKIHQFDNQKLFLLCDKPLDVLKLIEGGINFHKVNVGNMASGKKKRQITTSIAIDDEESQIFKKLYDKGIELEIKALPNMVSEDIQILLK